MQLLNFAFLLPPLFRIMCAIWPVHSGQFCIDLWLFCIMLDVATVGEFGLTFLTDLKFCHSLSLGAGAEDDNLSTVYGCCFELSIKDLFQISNDNPTRSDAVQQKLMCCNWLRAS